MDRVNSFMKILRLNSIVSFRGGAEAYIENITDMLSEIGHETLTITFVSGEENGQKPGFVEVKMSSNSVLRFIKDTIPWDQIVSYLLEKNAEFKPDIIHLHHLRNAFASVMKFLKMTEVPVVFTAHDALFVCPISTLVQPGNVICDGGTGIRCAFTGCKVHGHMTYELLLSYAIRKLSSGRIKAFLCPSYSIFNYLHNNGFGPVVHLPSFSKFDENVLKDEPEYEKILEKKNIGYIGRLESYKGVHDLLNAFSIFVKSHPDFKLKIAGTGGFEAELHKQADRMQLSPNIEWMGKINLKEREEFYKSVSAIVVPSNFWENFALVAQEALLRGIPTVGTNIGGIPEIVKDGITGRIVPISSPVEVAGAIEDIYSNTAKSLKLMKEGRTFILNNISPERHLEGLLKVYDRILQKKPIKDESEALEL